MSDINQLSKPCRPSCQPHYPGFDAVIGRTSTCPRCGRVWEIARQHIDVYWRLKK